MDWESFFVRSGYSLVTKPSIRSQDILHGKLENICPIRHQLNLPLPLHIQISPLLNTGEM